MDFASAYLFNKTPEDLRRVGALGGRARARNLRLRKARQAPVARELSCPHEETAAEATRRIDALCPWLVGCGALRVPAAARMRALPAGARSAQL
jgi:hypothetical protein